MKLGFIEKKERNVYRLQLIPHKYSTISFSSPLIICSSRSLDTIPKSEVLVDDFIDYQLCKIKFHGLITK